MAANRIESPATPMQGIAQLRGRALTSIDDRVIVTATLPVSETVPTVGPVPWAMTEATSGEVSVSCTL